MYEYIIEVINRYGVKLEYCIKEERYLKPILNVLQHYHNENNIVIIDKFRNRITYDNFKTY